MLLLTVWRQADTEAIPGDTTYSAGASNSHSEFLCAKGAKNCVPVFWESLVLI